MWWASMMFIMLKESMTERDVPHTLLVKELNSFASLLSDAEGQEWCCLIGSWKVVVYWFKAYRHKRIAVFAEFWSWKEFRTAIMKKVKEDIKGFFKECQLILCNVHSIYNAYDTDVCWSDMLRNFVCTQSCVLAVLLTAFLCAHVTYSVKQRSWDSRRDVLRQKKFC